MGELRAKLGVVQECGKSGPGARAWRARGGVPVGARLPCPWVAEGPGRGAGGWRQGQGGPRDRSLRAAGSRVAISRAGRRPPAHTAARPTEAGPAARTASGRAAAHRHTERPDRTRQIMRSGRRAHRAARPDTTRGAQNTSGATQQAKQQQHNEKCPLKHQHSQLHSNTHKSHMRNMRAS